MKQPPLFGDDELVSEETRKKWSDRLAFIMDSGSVLNEWEGDFMDSISQKLADGKDLTLAQSSKLNQIFHKIEVGLG